MTKTIKITSILLMFLLVFAFFSSSIFKTGVVYSKGENLTTARGMCVLETSTNRVLYSKNMHEKMPMASTTKIITAISVLSKISDLDQKAVIPRDAVKIPGTSIYLEEGESLTIRELLYGLMLRSGNDAAVALAILAFGSVQQFLDYTNEYVKTLGVYNTRLANPHGLDDSNHYTTPYDLALITSHALKNKNFAEIVKTKEKVISKEFDKNGNKRLLKNKNKLLINYEYADGVKTGYTGRAGRSFVGSATKDGMQVVCSLLNCNPMFEECEQLLEKAFSEYKLVKLLDRSERGSIAVEGSSKIKSINTLNKNEFYYPLKDGEIENLKFEYKINSKVSVPINNDTVVGQIDVKLGNHLIFSDKIYTIKEIDEDKVLDKAKDIIYNFIGHTKGSEIN